MYFLPSEISRLTYGYLRRHCNQNLADEFSKSCPSMKECRQMKHKYGRNFHATVQDLSLETILDQYSRLCSLIFECFDEDKRQHRNVLDLLEIILKRHPLKDSSCKEAQVFKDVQNVPSNRHIPEIEISKTQGRENVPLVLEGIETSTDQCKKKEPAPSIQLTDRESGATKESLSHTEAKNTSPDCGKKVSQNDFSQDLSYVHENQQAVGEVNASNTQSNVLIPRLSPEESILPSRNIQPKIVCPSIDSNLKSSPGKSNLSPETVLKQVVEVTDRQGTESLLMEPAPAKIGSIDFDYSNNQSVTNVNDSSRITLESHSPTLACENETCGDERTEKLSSETINKQEDQISSCESAKMISSGHLVSTAPSVQADWKSVFCNSFKLPTPRKGPSQKKSVSGTKITSQSGASEIQETVPPQERLQVLFENMSKGFKHRSHPYFSPAKGLLHPAALSPLSKIYVTPTKPKNLDTAALNHSVASNATSNSSISSSQRSIFSPVSFDSPSSKEILEEQSERNTAKKRLSSKVSISEEEVPVKRKRCHHQKPELSYGVNDEIVKKVNKTTNKDDSHTKKVLCSRSTKSSKKKITSKNKQNVDSVGEKENKTSIKKNSRVAISSSQKSSKIPQNEENDCKNELKVRKEDTKKMVPGSTKIFNIEDMFRQMVLRVFVKDTCEIAELDVSSEFLIYHRDSA